MFKADICRGTALYETGGLYFDVDLHVSFNLFDTYYDKNKKDDIDDQIPVIPYETEFVVPRVHRQSKYRRSFFEAFIGITSQHPTMKQYLDLSSSIMKTPRTLTH